jgi:hypothetical protein
MNSKYDFSWLFQQVSITYRDAPLVTITINKDALGVLCAEDLANILTKGGINFDKVLGKDHALHLIQEFIAERPQDVGQKATFEIIRAHITTMTQHILERLPERINELIDDLMTDGMAASGIKLELEKRELSKAARTIIRRRAKQSEKDILKSIGLKEDARGGSEGKWTEEERAEYLEKYETVLRQIKDKSPDLPPEILEKRKLRGEKPSDIAREYAAELLGKPVNDYLHRVLTQARRERGRRTMKRAD